MRKLKISGSPKLVCPATFMCRPIVDHAKPKHEKIRVGTSPASGPEMPMSNRARRLPSRASITITAPMVPKGDIGIGMK